jgi:hypothetical protein
MRSQTREILNALVVDVRQRTTLDAEARERTPFHDSATEIHAQLVASDAVNPGESLPILAAAVPRTVGERPRERLTHKINSNLWLQRPAREEPQQVRGVRPIQPGEIIRVKRHRSTYICASPDSVTGPQQTKPPTQVEAGATPQPPRRPALRRHPPGTRRRAAATAPHRTTGHQRRRTTLRYLDARKACPAGARRRRRNGSYWQSGRNGERGDCRNAGRVGREVPGLQGVRGWS